MSPRSVKISLRAAKALHSRLKAEGATDVDERRAFVELDLALAPKPIKSWGTTKATKAKKKATKKEETAAIREAVMKRAGGRCECCGKRLDVGWLDQGEMDHFFPKGRTPQTERTCWVLRVQCHREKTRNEPSAHAWLERFIAHANRHGYSKESAKAFARLEAMERVELASSLSRSSGAP